MPFTPRTVAQIRESLLNDRNSRHIDQTGQPLLITPGSDAYMECDALAIELELLEQQASITTDAILPDTATSDALDRHGDIENVPREDAIPTTIVARVTGTPSTLVTFGGYFLSSTASRIYRPTTSSVTLNGSGYFDTSFISDDTGEVANVPVGTTLNWSTVPINANGTAVVQSVTTPAEDEEDDDAYRERILSVRRERPAGGNRADWKSWGEAFTGIKTTYVYPLVEPGTYTGNVLGCVTILVLGPPPTYAQAYDPTFTSRVINGTTRGYIKDYIEGIRDKDGNTVSNGVQLRPVGISFDDFGVISATEVNADVTLQITQSAATAFPWTGTFAVSGSTTTRVDVTGDASALAGKSCAFFCGSSLVRGGYVIAKVGTATYNSPSPGLTRLDALVFGDSFGSVFPGGVGPTGTVYPAAPNDDELRRAIFSYFDALGPGDHTEPHSARWPTQEQQGRSVLYISAISGKALTVTGVLSCNVTSPVGDQTPLFAQMYKLQTLLITAP